MQPPDIYLLVTPAAERDEIYAVELVERGRVALAVEAESLEPVIALHGHLRRSLGAGHDAALPIFVGGGDRYALTTLRDGFGLDARLAPAEHVVRRPARPSQLAALVAPDTLESMGSDALRALDRELAGALARLRAWRGRDAGRPPALIVEAAAVRLAPPGEGEASYVLSADQPWPQPLEGFREQFAGALDGDDVRLEYRDATIAVSIRPLGADVRGA